MRDVLGIWLPVNGSFCYNLINLINAIQILCINNVISFIFVSLDFCSQITIFGLHYIIVLFRKFRINFCIEGTKIMKDWGHGFWIHTYSVCQHCYESFDLSQSRDKTWSGYQKGGFMVWTVNTTFWFPFGWVWLSLGDGIFSSFLCNFIACLVYIPSGQNIYRNWTQNLPKPNIISYWMLI